ncbi:MAG: hypothetical protein ACOYKJ_08940 [Candidatus Howiella sp.]|jgi:hypothetical protein
MTLEKILASPEILLCAGEVKCPVTLGGRELELRLLSAYEAAVCLREAARLEERLAAEQLDNSAALAYGACLCAGSLYDGLGRVFETGDEALLRLTADEIALVSDQYGALRRSDFDIDGLDGDGLHRLKQAMENAALGRIRWRVLRALRRLPSEGAVKRMTDAQYLYCYIQLLLDGELPDEEGINLRFAREEDV